MPFTKLYNFNFVCLATHNSSDRPNMGNNGMSEQGRIFSRNNGSSVGSSVGTLYQGNQSSGKMRLSEFSLNIARLAHISTSELS